MPAQNKKLAASWFSRFPILSLSRLLAFTLILDDLPFVQTDATAKGTQFQQRSAAVNCAL